MRKKIIIGFIPLFIANLVFYGVIGVIEYIKDTKKEWKRERKNEDAEALD